VRLWFVLLSVKVIICECGRGLLWCYAASSYLLCLIMVIYWDCTVNVGGAWYIHAAYIIYVCVNCCRLKRWYYCPHCGRITRKAYNHKIHVLTHTNHFPFPCDQCDMKFRRKDHLRDHRWASECIYYSNKYVMLAAMNK